MVRVNFKRKHKQTGPGYCNFPKKKVSCGFSDMPVNYSDNLQKKSANKTLKYEFQPGQRLSFF